MLEEKRKAAESNELALRLYDKWIRERYYKRPEIRCSEKKEDLEKFRKENFINQVVKPRHRHLKDLKEVSKAMTMSDKVALMVMMELPPLEISSLTHRLGMQIAENPDARYFSVVNQADNCGSGCG